MIKHLIAAALLTAPQIAAAQEQAKACVTRAEATDIALFVAPGFIEGVAGKCGAALPQSAFLRTGAGALAQKLRAEGDRWGAVKGSLAKIAGEPLPPGLSDETARKVFEEATGAAILADIETGDCDRIDTIVGALAPLPAANFATLIVAFLELGMESDGAEAPFRICPAGR